MKQSLSLIIVLALFFSSCQSKKKETGSSDSYLNIKEGKIESCFSAQPSPTIDVQELQKQYAQYPERWEAAFRFLCTTDFSGYPLGRVDITSEVFASVGEYTTKDSDEATYESHQKYVDIQYVASGKEWIELTRDTALPVRQAYDPESDLAFYDHRPGQMLEANSGIFFIFFPQDIHRPCIADGEKSEVRKVVVKIKYN